MSDLANYRKHSLAKQVVALKHRLHSFRNKLGSKVPNVEDRKLLGMIFALIERAVDDLFYRDRYDKVCEIIAKHFKVSSEQIDEIHRDFGEIGVITEEHCPNMPIIEKDEPLNYWRVMRELCEDVEKELEEKLRQEGKE